MDIEQQKMELFMKYRKSILINFIIMGSINPQPTEQEKQWIVQQFPCKSYFDRMQKNVMTQSLETLQATLSSLLTLITKTGPSPDNFEMPEHGLSYSSEFFLILCLHSSFDNHPERTNFIGYSQILAKRSKNFLQTMKASTTTK